MKVEFCPLWDASVTDQFHNLVNIMVLVPEKRQQFGHDRRGRRQTRSVIQVAFGWIKNQLTLLINLAWWPPGSLCRWIGGVHWNELQSALSRYATAAAVQTRRPNLPKPSWHVSARILTCLLTKKFVYRPMIVMASEPYRHAGGKA